MQSSHLRFESCGVTVTSNQREDLDWLAAFLACGFEADSHNAGDRHVALTVDAAAYDRLLARRSPGDGIRVEGFAKDSEPSLLERWPADGASAVYQDLRRPIVYLISKGGDRIEILARERTPNCRTALMRVVRELAMDWVVATGGLLLHGSAVRIDAGVVAICGPKRSGKTTLLMSLLQTPGTSYVANDRCVVRWQGDGASVRGLPTLVSIRCDSLDPFPVARQRLAAIRPDLVTCGRMDRASVSLSPPEFCELMDDCPSDSGGPLLALIHPRVTDDPTMPMLRRLDAAESLERLRQGLFRAGHASPLGEAFVSRAGATAGARPETLLRIAEGIPSFDCRLGRGAVPGTRECRALLTRVAQEASR